MAMQRRPPPMVITRTPIEEAAIAICRAIYPSCACARAPTICASMMLAALSAEVVFSAEREP